MSALNVNLKPCLCQVHHPRKNDGGFILYTRVCTGGPVLIPCPISPSVTFMVRLGECTGDGCATLNDTRGYHRETVHGLRCPASPIRVTCSISGKTWEESEVTLAEGQAADGRLIMFTEGSPVLDACRERWALVKALVLGEATLTSLGQDVTREEAHLVHQRDAVFAALADMARAEKAHEAAMRAFLGAGLPERVQVEVGHHAPQSLAGVALAAYVEHLVEQVGVLP